MRSKPVLIIAAILVAATAPTLLLIFFLPSPSDIYTPRKPNTLTFTKDIAPIVFENCSSCHRPGQSAPFPLLSYRDVQKRAQQIVDVTQSRYMPPWMPEPGYGQFANERRLTPTQLGILQQWVSEGAPEGTPSNLPPLPKWPEGWQLAQPELVVTMPAPFTLRPDGPDLYRNFVIPIPLLTNRFVKAIEFDPGNPTIVHHAFIKLDRTRQSRRRDEQDPDPGFDGIHAPSSAQPPEGYFLSWQPGKTPSPAPEGFAWPLYPGTDVVLQLHLQPSGKPEVIQSRIGFHFADRPTQADPLKIWLSSYSIDIPAGQSDYVLEDSYVLPVDVDLMSILPHAHYLAKEMQAFATLPNGTRQWLLRIKNWDFNWQGDYPYAKPVPLPKGATLSMRFIYDNSTNNPANPNQPPQRVQYGLNSTDEMGELWLQVLPPNDAGRAAIARDYQARVIQDTFAYNQYLLNLNPNDGEARSGIGKALYFQGRQNEAAREFQTAIQLAPNLDEPHYFLGLILRRLNRLLEAQQQFATAVQLNPENAKAQGNLGMVLLDLNNLPQAKAHLAKALELDPQDALTQSHLDAVLKAKAK